MRKHLFYWLILSPFILIAQNFHKSNQMSNAYLSKSSDLTIPYFINHAEEKPDHNVYLFNKQALNTNCSHQFEGDYFNAVTVFDNWIAANDINVEANTQYVVQSIEFEIITSEGEPTTFDISFFKDNNDSGPGIQLGASQTNITPTSITPNGIWGNSGYNIYKIVIDLPQSTILHATSSNDVKYWIGISGAETTEDSFLLFMASSLYEESLDSRPTYISDGGIWLEYVDTDGQRLEGILKVNGLCEPIQGCLDSPNGQFPNYIFSPSCTGIEESITNNNALTGQYSMVEVSNNILYTFSSSVSSDFITITDENGSETLAAGIGSINWTADFDGNIRFYIHLNSNCESDNIAERSRKIKCGIPVCEIQEVESNNFENGYNFSGWTEPSYAFDIPVGEAGFDLYGIEFNIISNFQNLNFSITVYEEMDGVPGEIVITPEIESLDSEFIGNTSSGDDIFRYKSRFSDPVELSPETNYWIEVKLLDDLQQVYWESTTASVLGKAVGYRNLSTGFNWGILFGKELVYKLICEDHLTVNDADLSNFSYYPNPVKDNLHLISTQEIKKIEVYNPTGQLILKSDNPINKNISLKNLSAGAYFFKVTLDNKQIETFKIIKQ